MTREDLLNLISEEGPKDAYQRLVLMQLALLCDLRLEVSVSPSCLAQRVALAEKTVQGVLHRLVTSRWLDPLTGGGFQLLTPPTARARPSKELILNLKPNIRSNNQLRDRTDYVEVKPTTGARGKRDHVRTRRGLGVDGCPSCGGTGWREVASPDEAGHLVVVDACSCHGGLGQ